MLRRFKKLTRPALSLLTALICVGAEVPLETIVSEQSVQLNQLQQQIAQLKQHLHSRGPGGQAAIDAVQLSQPPSTVNGIKLDIQYPGVGGEGGGLEPAGATPGFSAGPAPKKTPLIIIAPKPLMSFNKLYEKMLVESQQAGSDASQILKGQDEALDNPMERIKVLANQEEEAAAKEAFYKADEEEMNYVLRERKKGFVGGVKTFFHDVLH